jgi:FtsP/CotA-like multicopper oxidase with cupredoxin domain
MKERPVMRGLQGKRARLGGLALGLLVGGVALVPTLASSQSGGSDPVGTQIVNSGQSTGAVNLVAVNGSIDLCAKTATITVAGDSVPIWGYVVKPTGVTCADAPAPTLPGPALAVNDDASVTITLYNALSEFTSLVFPGQTGIVPDTTGVAPGSSRTYTFTASEPGTYLYESGRSSARQVAMGLHGALVVRPSTAGQAYGGPATAYDSEALLVLSEIDPALNAAPTTFPMGSYKPRYWLINGKAFPQTDLISAHAGDRLLLRWLNAGNAHQTMTLLGAHQQVVAKDAAPERHPYDVVAETIAAGQTSDAIVRVPADAAAGTKLPLYNRDMRLTNGSAFPGGMLTYVRVP